MHKNHISESILVLHWRHWGYRGYVPRLGSHGRTLVPRKANKASHELSNLWCGCFIGEKNALSLGSTFPPQVKSLIHDILHWVMPFIKDAWFMVHALFFSISYNTFEYFLLFWMLFSAFMTSFYSNSSIIQEMECFWVSCNMLKTHVLAHLICHEIFHFELRLGIQHANSLKLEQQACPGHSNSIQ